VDQGLSHFDILDASAGQFVAKFFAKVKALKVGNGFEEGETQDPLIKDAAVDKVSHHVADVIATSCERTGRMGLGYSHGWLPDTESEPLDIPCVARLNNKCVAWPALDGTPMLITVGTSPPPMESTGA